MSKPEQLNIDGDWEPVEKEDVDQDSVVLESMDDVNDVFDSLLKLDERWRKS